MTVKEVEDYGEFLQNASLPDLTTTIHSLQHRFLFVRDPFSRLFSCYVDKILAPNPVFWFRLGIPALKAARPSLKDVDTQKLCGHNVTFSEFLQHSVDTAWKSNVHLQPVSSRCSPCLFRFNLIGKMETFKNDALYIAAQFNVSQSQIGLDRMREDTAMDAIEDSTNDALSPEWLKGSTRSSCVGVDKKDVLLRILRKLQIRGIISWRVRFNFSVDEIEKMDNTTFIGFLSKARREFYRQSELDFQKSQAMKEAYSGVKPDLMKQLAERYQLDIQMFGYMEKMKKMLDLGDVSNTGAFDHKKPWDLSTFV